MATGSIGNVTTTRRSKSLVVSGSAITNDVAYVCPAGTYSDIYLDGISLVGPSGGVVQYAISSVKMNVICAGGAVYSEAFDSSTFNIVAGTGSGTFGALQGTVYLGTPVSSKRLSDGSVLPVDRDYSSAVLNPIRKAGTAIRLFAGDYISLNYTITNVTGSFTVYFNLTTIEVSSSV